MAGDVTCDNSEFAPVVSEMKSCLNIFSFSGSDYRGVMLFIRASKHRQRNIPTCRELNTRLILNDRESDKYIS